MHVRSAPGRPLELILCAQVSSPRFQGANPRDGTRESAHRLGQRHPLLAATVEIRGYDDVRFVSGHADRKCSADRRLSLIFLRYRPPTSVQDTVGSAEASLEYRTQTRDREPISIQTSPFYHPITQSEPRPHPFTPRILSSQHISRLILSSADPILRPRSPICHRPRLTINVEQRESDFELLICATHFLGYGMALHQFAHDFPTPMGSKNPVHDLQYL